MKFEDAVKTCHNRSAIYRTGDQFRVWTEDDMRECKIVNSRKVGDLVFKKYWKNHPYSLYERVPLIDQQFDDWEEYDPREEDNSSLYMFND